MPEPIIPAAVRTEWVDVAVPDETPIRGYLCRPVDADRPLPAIIIAHELFGVTADIRTVAETLAGQRFIAIAPQFYHREPGGDAELPRDEDGRRTGFAHLHRLTREHALADVRALLAYLAGRDDTAPEVGLLGFSAGGHLAFLAATALPVTATAVLYGGWLPSTEIPLSRPEPTLSRAGGITGSLLYLVGGRDTLIPDTQVKEIRDALQAAGVEHEVVVYPEAEHAFFWPGTPGHDADATADAWRRLLAYFTRTLRQP